MVLGLTGTGKTTLVNYLNGVQLECYRDRITRKWILEVASNSTSLPCGFKIGHGTLSETIYPAVYTAPGEDFSYVDNPGFQDNRGISMEIANNFFRNYVTEDASQFKFLLLLTHQDLELRGLQFRDTIKKFSEILGIFSSPSVKKLSKSVAIIITRVENDGDTDDEIKTVLSGLLLKILNEEKKTKLISGNEGFDQIYEVFTQIIKDKQIEIFSNPKTPGIVSDKQSKQIKSLINSMSYLNKDDAQFRVVLSSNLDELLVYIEDRYSKFKQTVEATLRKNISEYVKNEISKAIVIEEVKNIESTLRDITSIGSQSVDLKKFIDTMNENILDTVSKETLIDKYSIIEFFIQLLPVSLASRFTGDKNYLNEFNLETMLNNQINSLTNMQKLETGIENSVMKINGCFIKSSEIIKEIKKSAKVSAIVVYSCQAVHFDTSLDLQNLDNLTIISPKWNVEKDVNIDLSGSLIHTYAKANPASMPAASGTNGLPGRAGKNGGQFYGYGNIFSNLGKYFFNNFL